MSQVLKHPRPGLGFPWRVLGTGQESTFTGQESRAAQAWEPLLSSLPTPRVVHLGTAAVASGVGGGFRTAATQARPDLWSWALPFNQVPRWRMATFKFEKLRTCASGGRWKKGWVLGKNVEKHQLLGTSCGGLDVTRVVCVCNVHHSFALAHHPSLVLLNPRNLRRSHSSDSLSYSEETTHAHTHTHTAKTLPLNYSCRCLCC